MKRDPSDRWILFLSMALALVTGALAAGAFQLHHYLTAFGLLVLAAAGTVFAALIVDHVALLCWFLRTFLGPLKELCRAETEFEALDDDDDDDDDDHFPCIFSDDEFKDDSDFGAMMREMGRDLEGRKRSFLSLLLQKDRPLRYGKDMTLIMTGGSDALAAGRQPKHLLRFDLKMADSFCVDSLRAVKALLAKARTAVGIAEKMGFISQEAKVGGGVQEWDTGCMPFDARYRNFSSMEKNLAADFQEVGAKKLDGRYFCRLNFAFMQITLEKDEQEVELVFSRGMLTAAVFGDSLQEQKLLNDLGSCLSRPWPSFYSLR